MKNIDAGLDTCNMLMDVLFEAVGCCWGPGEPCMNNFNHFSLIPFFSCYILQRSFLEAERVLLLTSGHVRAAKEEMPIELTVKLGVCKVRASKSIGT